MPESEQVEEESELTRVTRTLLAVGPESPGVDQKVEMLGDIRHRYPEHSPGLDETLLTEITLLRSGLQRAGRDQQELRRVFERLSAPPWRVAIFLGSGPAGGRESAAIVSNGGTRSVVNFAEDVDPSTIMVGDEVLLAATGNLVVGKSPYSQLSSGETAVFDRLAADGRIVVRIRDEEFVLGAADRLARQELRAGDVVRWDRNLWLAFEQVERSQGNHLFLDSTPTETFSAVGGLDAQIRELQRTIRLHYAHGDIVRKYALPRRAAVLLAGPPGTGKTLIARALANWLAELSPSGRSRFMNVKPGSLHSMWYSQSEANYREAFRVAREAGDQEPDVPVVMFFDEVDAIGGARGANGGGVDDRVMTAFLAELNGLESRGNVLVVCATNRRDALDPALLRSGGRLGDIILEIPRPNRRAAREIFRRHLPASIPFHVDVDIDAAGAAGGAGGGGGAEAAARDSIIDAAVARIFGPNGQGELVTLSFRDGTRRGVGPAELVSGAAIANIARRALEHACQREADGGSVGVSLPDLLTAVDAEFDSAARTLTPANCRRFLESLPQDVDVVRVERVSAPKPRTYRYLSVA